MGAWGTDAGWLLPAAGMALLAAAVLTRGRNRRDPLRAGLLLWGTWLVVVALVLGSLHGIAHGYYTVQLAPAIAGSLALGAAVLWRRSWGIAGVRWPRALLILGLLVNAVWGTLLTVHRHSSPPVVVIGVVAATALVGGVSAEVRAAGSGSRWAAAVVGHRAADLQLASDAPVLALGGYNGTDPHPTLPEFLAAAAHRQVRYLVVTASDARARGEAGRIVRWALACMAVQHTHRWMLVDLAEAAASAARCSAR